MYTPCSRYSYKDKCEVIQNNSGYIYCREEVIVGSTVLRTKGCELVFPFARAQTKSINYEIKGCGLTAG